MGFKNFFYILRESVDVNITNPFTVSRGGKK